MSKKKKIDPDWRTMPLDRLIMCLHTGTVRRKHVRYRLFRIREDKDMYDNGLRDFIEKQFKPGMFWKDFTFDWDVSPKDPLKLISPYEWNEEGGRHVILDSKTRICDPSAFTKQA